MIDKTDRERLRRLRREAAEAKDYLCGYAKPPAAKRFSSTNQPRKARKPRKSRDERIAAIAVVCGDARDPAVLALVMQGHGEASLVLTDQPYNVRIRGHVTGGAHREFVMGSGEMSDEDFAAFTSDYVRLAVERLCDGGVFGTFIDWRGLQTVNAAALAASLTPVNLIVWHKTNAGMGSPYRSQHELLPLFRKGTEAIVDNVKLGRKGRWRSNLWTYPGASSLGSDARRGLRDHPTVKPTVMLEDALLDLTNRGDVVIDPFLGSGSTLIAAERCGRICCGIELDPLYVDVICRRYRAVTGKAAVHADTGQPFEELAALRATEAPDQPASDTAAPIWGGVRLAPRLRLLKPPGRTRAIANAPSSSVMIPRGKAALDAWPT